LSKSPPSWKALTNRKSPVTTALCSPNFYGFLAPPGESAVIDVVVHKRSGVYELEPRGDVDDSVDVRASEGLVNKYRHGGPEPLPSGVDHVTGRVSEDLLF
jgi:hypothetical protein